MKRALYAKIQHIVEGKEQEPPNPPQLLFGSSQGEKDKESHNSAGFKQGEGHEESNDDGEENDGEENGGEGNGGEGNGEGEGNDGTSDHQKERGSNKLSKLHRPLHG